MLSVKIRSIFENPAGRERSSDEKLDGGRRKIDLRCWGLKQTGLAGALLLLLGADLGKLECISARLES